MATTRIMPLHTGTGRSVTKALKDSIDYMENPLKTDNGEWISSYECDARTADNEFLLSKQRYASLTGRSQGGNDVIAYHVRQSFKPGEVTPEGVCYKRCFNNIENMRSSRLVCGRISGSAKGG